MATIVSSDRIPVAAPAMKFSHKCLLFLGSLALGAVLLGAVIQVGKIDTQTLRCHLRGVRPNHIVSLVIITALLVVVCTEKWLGVDEVLRDSGDSIPSRSTCYAVTSAGLALGVLLPVQISMSIARTLGTYLHGRAFRRGTAGTLVEQAFDLLVVGLLGLASITTLFRSGRGTTWIVSAVTILLVVLWLVRGLMRFGNRICQLYATVGWIPPCFRLRGLEFSWLLTDRHVALARRLILLSVIRFAFIVFMSYETAEAIELRVPMWAFATAIPFVIMASVVALTPGGLGVNELTWIASLKLLGIPISVAAEWALMNRVLVSISYGCAAGAFFAVEAVIRMTRRVSHLQAQSDRWVSREPAASPRMERCE